MEARETHPSYGMIQFNRVSGAGRLFGSPLPQHFGTIRLEIRVGERNHDDGEDRYWARLQIVEVELSASQFAEAITCMNVGKGVPCTIRRLNGRGVGDVPDAESGETERAEESFRERVCKFLDDVKKQREKVDAILAKDRLTKDDRQAIRGSLDFVLREVGQNMPFFVTLFTESAEKIKVKAKAEIAAMLDHAIRLAGMEHVQRHLVGRSAPELPAKDDAHDT